MYQKREDAVGEGDGWRNGISVWMVSCPEVTAMSLHSQQPIPPVPEDTVRVAQAAFRRGNPYMLLRDRFGAIFDDAGFADLYPARTRHSTALRNSRLSFAVTPRSDCLPANSGAIVSQTVSLTTDLSRSITPALAKKERWDHGSGPKKAP
jgi:hypothetical protein